MASGGSVDKSELGKVLKMADGIISEIDASLTTATISSSAVLQRRDRAHEYLKDYHKNLINKLAEHQRYFERLLHELCTKRQSEFQQIIAGVNERSLQVRNLKSEIESFETDPTKTSNDLAQIFDRMKLLKLENDKITAVDALQKLLEMEFDYQEQSDTLNSSFSLNSSVSRINGNCFDVATPTPKPNLEPIVSTGRGYPANPPPTGGIGRARQFESLLRPPGLSADGTRLGSSFLNSSSDSEVPPEEVKKRETVLEKLKASAAAAGAHRSLNGVTVRNFNAESDENSSGDRPTPTVSKIEVNAQKPSSQDRIPTPVRRGSDSNENWDDETADNNRISLSVENTVPPAAFADENNAAGAYTPRKRPDLTNLIKPGRGIAAKFVLEMGRYGKTDPADTYFYKPIGCTCNEHAGCYIICDTEHNAVKVYDRQGRPQVMIDGNENKDCKLHRPSAVCIVENDRFIIKDNKKLYKFEADGQLVDVYDNGGQFKHLFGMAQDNRGVLLTMDLMNARAGECPVLYGVDDKTGKVLFQNEFATAKGVQNSKCYFMDCYDDTLVVSDLGLHKVYVCDATGRLKLTFGEHEMVKGEAGKFNQPSGVTIDAAKNIFVGDACNNRVQIWTHLGEYLGDVAFSNQIHRPSDIHLTADGHLMVMNISKHFVSVYKLEALP